MLSRIKNRGIRHLFRKIPHAVTNEITNEMFCVVAEMFYV